MRVLWFLLLQIGIKTRALETHSVSTVWRNSKKVNENIRKITQAKSQLEGGFCCLW